MRISSGWRSEAAAERGISVREFEELLDRRADELGGLCHYCGIETRKSLTYRDGRIVEDARSWDHRIPKSRGGSHGDENLVLSCWGCNRRKAAYMHDDDELELVDLSAAPAERGIVGIATKQDPELELVRSLCPLSNMRILDV